MRALLVEDDASFALLVRSILEREGFAVDLATTGSDALSMAHVNDYDCIVLDLGLPDQNGVTIVQSLRREGRTTPLLVLTGNADAQTSIRLLDAGADDYVTKPVVAEQLRARIRALVRRGGARRTEGLVCGNLVLNRLTRQILVNGTEVALTAKEFPLLEHLLLRVGEVVSRTELLEHVWDMHFDPGSNVVDVNVARIRKKLADAGADARIQARRGVGFVLMAADATA